MIKTVPKTEKNTKKNKEEHQDIMLSSAYNGSLATGYFYVNSTYLQIRVVYIHTYIDRDRE